MVVPTSLAPQIWPTTLTPLVSVPLIVPRNWSLTASRMARFGLGIAARVALITILLEPWATALMLLPFCSLLLQVDLRFETLTTLPTPQFPLCRGQAARLPLLAIPYPLVATPFIWFSIRGSIADRLQSWASALMTLIFGSERSRLPTAVMAVLSMPLVTTKPPIPENVRSRTLQRTLFSACR